MLYNMKREEVCWNCDGLESFPNWIWLLLIEVFSAFLSEQIALSAPFAQAFTTVPIAITIAAPLPLDPV